MFFRDFARHHARQLGLSGWVRNQSDGESVEVVAEGAHTGLQELIAQLREGPPYAVVTEVDVEWGTAQWEFGPFRIR